MVPRLIFCLLLVLLAGCTTPVGNKPTPLPPKSAPVKAALKSLRVPVPMTATVTSNVTIQSIQRLPGNTFAVRWTGPENAEFQLLQKTNVVQSSWSNLGGPTTNYAATNPVVGKAAFIKVAATTHETTTPGTVRWLKGPTTQAGVNCRGRAAVQDHQGNVIVAGSYQGNIIFDGVTLTNAGGNDLFLVKYNSGGALVWAKRIGGNLDDFANGLAVDASDNIVMVGDFSGTVDFGGTSLTYTTPVFGTAPDGFIAKYNPAGLLIWVKQLTGSSGDSGSAVAVDSASNVYVACQISSTNAALAPFSLSGSSSTDIAVVKLSPVGVPVWAIRKGGPDIDLPRSIAANTTEVWVSGQFRTSIDLGGGSVPSLGDNDAFLAKYNAASGNYIMSKIVGTTGTDIGYGCAIDAGGNAYLAGQIGGQFDFGCGQVGPGGIFLVSYNPAGNCRWARCLNHPNFGFSPDADFASNISAEGNVFITGQVRSTVSFDGSSTSIGNTTPNYFSASYSASTGAFRWSSRATAFAIGQAMSSGSAAGSFSGTLTLGGQSIVGPVFGAAPFAVNYVP